MARTLSVFLAALVSAATAAVDLDAPVHDEKLILSINSDPKSTWKAGKSERFADATLRDVKRLLGVKHIKGPKAEAAKSKLGKWDLVPLSPEHIPDSYSVVEQYGGRCPSIAFVRDQSSCGSCWAVSSESTFNDRLCIVHNSTIIMTGSTALSCCNFFGGCMTSSGCDGGEPSEAWNYFQQTGAVTSGAYGSTSGSSCYPYPFAQCSHHVNGTYPHCPQNEYNTPSCPVQNGAGGCTDSKYPIAWNQDKHFATSSYGLPTDVASIQTEILSRGSVTAAFTVYDDFPTYKSGVYQAGPNAQPLGGHAVRMVGWGVESGTPYWLIANSWNDSWGDNGYFKILRGQDECGIEDSIVAGTV